MKVDIMWMAASLPVQCLRQPVWSTTQGRHARRAVSVGSLGSHISQWCLLGSFNVTVPKRLTPTAMQQWVQRKTRRPASADRTARRQFQVVFPVINGSFPTNVIAHLHGLSMDLTVGRTVGPTVDSTVGWTVRLTLKLCKHWFDSRSNYSSNCGNHWPTSEPNAG